MRDKFGRGQDTSASFGCVMIIKVYIRRMTRYMKAKNIYFSLGVMKDSIIDCDNVPNFRKHLTEFEFRQNLGRQFTTKILDNRRLLIKRIK